MILLDEKTKQFEQTLLMKRSKPLVAEASLFTAKLYPLTQLLFSTILPLFPPPKVTGLIQAVMVKLPVRLRLAPLPASTESSTPSKERAPPILPVVQAGPFVNVPVFVFTEESAVVAPDPSSNFHQAARFGIGVGVGVGVRMGVGVGVGVDVGVGVGVIVGVGVTVGVGVGSTVEASLPGGSSLQMDGVRFINEGALRIKSTRSTM